MGKVFLIWKAPTALLLAAGLAACGGTGNSDTASTANTPPVRTASSAPTVTAAPELQNEPMTVLRVGELFYFEPEIKGRGNESLDFTAANLPAWMRLNPTTGELNGMPQPEDVGSYRGIAVHISDGTTGTLLLTFDVDVNAIASGAAQLSWSAPLQNAAGGALSLVGYRIRYGRSARALNQSIAVANPSVTEYTVDNLSNGLWYFDVVAISGDGAQSAPSNLNSKRI